MKFTFLLLSGLLGCLPAVGAEGKYSTSIRSRSGQFIVQGALEPRPPAQSAARAVGLVELRPQTLVVTCERVKQSLLRELGLPDRWRSRIHITIVPAITSRQQSVVTSTRHLDGWKYEVEIPEEMTEGRLMRLLVQVLLQELANRQATDQSAELPLWLLDGMTQHLLANATGELYAQVDRNANREGIRADPLRQVRLRLQTRPPLTFQELSWPPPEKVSHETWELFQSCSHLLVHELLKLHSGREALRNLVIKLPHRWNWQTSFLHSFSAHFTRLLDVEKWWAVTLVNFTGRNEWQQWSGLAAVQKLDALLRVAAEERASPDELPRYTSMPLQAVLLNWDHSRQQPVLRLLIQQLLDVRTLLPRDMLPLADKYRLAIDAYLLKRSTSGFTTSRGLPTLRTDPLTSETIKVLNQLDVERENFRIQYAADNSAANVKNSR